MRVTSNVRLINFRWFYLEVKVYLLLATGFTYVLDGSDESVISSELLGRLLRW